MMRLSQIFTTLRAFTLASATVAAAALMAGGIPAAEAQTAIRVLVNGKPITTYDVQSRARMLNVFTGGRQGEREALEQLIDEQIMLQEAELRGFEVSEDEIEQEIARRARQSNVTPEQFGQALAQAGVASETFREFLRASLAWDELVRARFQATVEITESQVGAALEAIGQAEERVQMSEYMLQQILFLGAGEADLMAKANAFRSNYQGCDQALQQASGTPGIVVRPTIRREEGELSPGLRESLAALQVGGISEPAPVEEGVQLVGICEKKAISGQTEASEEVRSELRNEQGSLMARRYLRDLRSNAVIEHR